MTPRIYAAMDAAGLSAFRTLAGINLDVIVKIRTQDGYYGRTSRNFDRCEEAAKVVEYWLATFGTAEPNAMRNVVRKMTQRQAEAILADNVRLPERVRKTLVSVANGTMHVKPEPEVRLGDELVADAPKGEPPDFQAALSILSRFNHDELREVVRAMWKTAADPEIKWIGHIDIKRIVGDAKGNPTYRPANGVELFVRKAAHRAERVVNRWHMRHGTGPYEKPIVKTVRSESCGKLSTRTETVQIPQDTKALDTMLMQALADELEQIPTEIG